MTAFDNEITTVPKIMTVLCSMSPLTRTTLIHSESFKIFAKNPDPNFRLPNQHPVPFAASVKNKPCGRPVAYITLSVGRSRSPPAAETVSEVMAMMRDYSAFQPDKHEWRRADAVAKVIDHHKGSIFKLNESGWTPTPAQERVWSRDKGGSLIDHPRRYRVNARNGESINKFCDALKERLASLESGGLHSSLSPLPWAISSVGWSRHPDERREQHHSHKGPDSVVKK